MKHLVQLLIAMIVVQAGLSTAHSYFIGSTDLNFNPHKRTHVFVSGRGDDLGELLQKAALSKAIYTKQIFPQDQILLIGVEEYSRDEQFSVIKRKGFSNIEFVPASLNQDRLFSKLESLQRIASLHFFTHSAVKFGLRLDSIEDRLEPTDDWTRIKKSLTSDSYIFLNGCNTGFILAPSVSSQLEVPTFGSMTATNIDRKASDGKFYEVEAKLPNGVRFACDREPCYRMSPDNAPYSGHWGKFNGGGLGFFKMFCNLSEKDQCLKTLSLTLATHIGSASLGNPKNLSEAKNNYQSVVLERLCPSYGSENTKAECVRQILNLNKNYNPFLGSPLQCSMTKCDFELTCRAFDDKCDLINPYSRSSTLINEYQIYMTAFDLLFKDLAKN